MGVMPHAGIASATIYSGGTVTVSSNGIFISAMVNNGGKVRNEGEMINAMVYSGGMVTVSSAGSMISGSVRGTVIVSPGGFLSRTDILGGSAFLSGARSISTDIYSGGVFVVSSGAFSIINFIVDGSMFVYSGGTAGYSGGKNLCQFRRNPLPFRRHGIQHQCKKRRTHGDLLRRKGDRHHGRRDCFHRKGLHRHQHHGQ